MRILLLLALFGGLYGFALYLRDLFRGFERWNRGEDGTLWLPEPRPIKEDVDADK